MYYTRVDRFAVFPVDPPARTTIEARLMASIMVEIDAIAYAPLG